MKIILAGPEGDFTMAMDTINGQAPSVVSEATRYLERIPHGHLVAPASWSRRMRNLIGWNHDARARDGIEDGLIRAERWDAVY